MAILIDTSHSMKDNHRTQLNSILDQLIDKLGVSPEGNHYADITFDKYAKIHHDLKDPLFHNLDDLKRDLNNSIFHYPKRGHWGTRADFALDLAANQLFTPEKGDRPKIKNVLLVVTDGEQLIARRDKRPLIPFSNSTKLLEVGQFVLNYVTASKNHRKMLFFKKEAILKSVILYGTL